MTTVSASRPALAQRLKRVQVAATVAMTVNGSTSPSPVTHGSVVTIASSVVGTSGPVVGIAVSLYDGTSLVATGYVQADGTTTFSTPNFAIRTHHLSLVFAGNSVYGSITTAPVTLQVV